MKQNTVEEFEFECSRYGKKVNSKSSIPVVEATTHQDLQDVISLLFHSLSMGNISKITTKFPGLSVWTTSVLINFTHCIHIAEWIAPFVKRIAGRSVQKVRTEAVRRGKKNPVRRLYLTLHDLPRLVICPSSLANNS